VSRLAAVLIGVALLAAAGCGGGGPNAQDVLKRTAANVGAIHSGTLGLKLVVTPSGNSSAFGFELHGPFRLATSRLPITRMAYTQITHGHRATATLVSDGKNAHVEVGAKQIPLSADQEQSLRNATQQLEGAGGVGQLAVGRWVQDAKASRDGNVDKVTGKLDVAEAATTLVDLARLSGRSIGTLSNADRQRIADAVRSSSFELTSGKDDHLLRSLQLTADIGFDVPPALKAALGDLVGARVEFDLSVANPKR
jgi:hypothetical protein